ncbi:hypothetical protein GGR42_001249 [Saonia flava]|uniref:Uncharacterized protein n=1 Tax=Saonia flava TaxID=523696 RepID=A0A846QU90_9FLAO|nr:hypothetical protein [Saonia flava]NJB70787.1 hypothetical protein [Saonia flava]
MKKPFFLFLSTLVLTFGKGFSQESGNYLLIINNDTTKINLKQAFEYKAKKGELLTIIVDQPAIQTYSDEMISFQYDKAYGASKTKIDMGIEQIMVMSSDGNGFIVQKYSSMDPSGLINLMMSELIKESITYGYKKTEEPYTKELKSGQTIKGIKNTLEYKGEEIVYMVGAHGGKDEGVLIVTMLQDASYTQNGLPMINLFLDSLQIKE